MYFTRTALSVGFAAVLPFVVMAHTHEGKVVVESTQVTENIYMITGQGGNIGLAVDEKYTLMIDDQFATLSDQIKSVIQEISDKQIAYLLNTHYHFDHTDGNANFSDHVGVIVAHDNVRQILKSGTTIEPFGREIGPYADAALPALTFNDKLTIHQAGEEVKLVHFASAHTGGDTVVFFEDSNVIHAGDLHFSGFYPFIDTGGGGSVEGYIAAQEAILAMIDEETKIIPGHGPLSTKADMARDLAMLRNVVALVETALAKGEGLEQLLQNKVIQAYDASHGDGFLNTETFLTILLNALK
ncbi:MAG: MBL fold metallo-hydrolase [Verrucomicrobiota bacterium]